MTNRLSLPRQLGRLPLRVGLPEPVARRVRSRAGHRGQSLSEFALTLPVVLLLVLFGLDFGRVFLGWVTLTNAAREAANFAAMNPTAWGLHPSATVQAEYARLVAAETSGANCTMPNPVPVPTFPNGTSLGSPANVEITCNFHLITPVIGNILGNLVHVTASSAYPVRSGIIEGIPTPSPAPTGTPTAAPTSTPLTTPSPTPSPTATPLVTPSPSPTPMCTVPNLVNVKSNQAPNKWSQAGFTSANLIFSPLVGPGNNYTIKAQSLNAGSSAACTSSMVVYDKVH
jgi:Flp pilus assembly protein TadG